VWRIIFDSSIGLTTALTALSIPKVDVTICVSPPIQTTLFASAASFKLGKVVILVQDLPVEAARSVGMLKGGTVLGLARRIEGLAYRLADHIVVISDRFTSYLHGLGVKNTRITVIPNWVDLDSIRPGKADQIVRHRLGASPQDFLIAHTGNMGAKQDLLNVVSAAALLKQEKQIKIALVGDGQEKQKISADIAARGLENVKLLPLQSPEDFPKVLRSSDVLLLNQAPMVSDSVSPSKLLSYMASGRPVLAAAHTSSTTAEIVQRADCGVVIEPGQPQTLASEILSFASRKGTGDELNAMGRRGRAYVASHFDPADVLRRWDKLLDILV
jgi:glycosyltransferase involved in cell wall biosynthesis